MSEGGYRQINKALNINAFEDFLNSQQSRLPKLADVEQISPRVLRVLGQNPGKFQLQGTNTFIVGTGSQRLIVDTAQGLVEWSQILSEALSERNITLSHVLLTHFHGDHTGGVPDLLRLYPHLSTAVYKNAPDKGQQPITDGQIFKVEGATIRAVHSPGHSHDHMCFLLEEENALFTGDNIIGHGTSAVEDLSIWMASMSKLQDLQCAIGYPAHGETIRDLPSKIKNELLFKTRRENRVVHTLSRIKKEEQSSGRGKGSVTLKQLVQQMHGVTNGALEEKALEPFTEEILRKLAGDGRTAFEFRRGEKRWFVVDPV